MLIKKCMCFFLHIDAIDDDVFDDETINDENNDEEQFQVQPTEDKSNFILVNARIDYQYRSDNLDNTCLYNFVGTFYKKKINETDLKYLSKSSTTEKQQDNQRGRPSNERFSFSKRPSSGNNSSNHEIQ